MALKRTALTRKTPLLSHKSLKSTGFKQCSYEEALQKKLEKEQRKPSNDSSARVGRPVKAAFGLKGRGRTKSDIAFQGRAVGVGCMACLLLGIRLPLPVLFHHSAGRNQGSAGDISEKKGMGLCLAHHKPSTAMVDDHLRGYIDQVGPSIHENRRLFEELIGSEEWVLLEMHRVLDLCPAWYTAAQWSEYLTLVEKDYQQEYARVHRVGKKNRH